MASIGLTKFWSAHLIKRTAGQGLPCRIREWLTMSKKREVNSKRRSRLGCRLSRSIACSKKCPDQQRGMSGPAARRGKRRKIFKLNKNKRRYRHRFQTKGVPHGVHEKSVERVREKKKQRPSAVANRGRTAYDLFLKLSKLLGGKQRPTGRKESKTQGRDRRSFRGTLWSGVTTLKITRPPRNSEARRQRGPEEGGTSNEWDFHRTVRYVRFAGGQTRT